MLTRYAGKPIAETPFANVQNPTSRQDGQAAHRHQRRQRPSAATRSTRFRSASSKHGQSGIEIERLRFPHIAKASTDLAVDAARCTRPTDNHGRPDPVPLGATHERRRFPRPWVRQSTTASGSLNDELPAVSLDRDPRVLEQERRPLHTRPRPRRASPLRVDLGRTRSTSASLRAALVSRGQPSPGSTLLAERLNLPSRRPRTPKDPPHRRPAIKASYELAFRMRRSVPECPNLDFRARERRNSRPLRSPT